MVSDKQNDGDALRELQRAAKAVLSTDTARDNEVLRRAAMSVCKQAGMAAIDKK